MMTRPSAIEKSRVSFAQAVLDVAALVENLLEPDIGREIRLLPLELLFQQALSRMTSNPSFCRIDRKIARSPLKRVI